MDTLNIRRQKNNWKDEVGIVRVRRKENWRNERRRRENRLGVFLVRMQSAGAGFFCSLYTGSLTLGRLYRVDYGKMHGALFNCNLLVGVPGPRGAWEHGLTTEDGIAEQGLVRLAEYCS